MTKAYRRAFASILDYLLYCVIADSLWAAVMGSLPKISFNIPLILLADLCMLILEPIMAVRWVSTPGKALLGIRVIHKSGRRLTYKEGLIRTFQRLAFGMGFCLPGISIIAMINSFIKISKGEELIWNKNIRYTILESKHDVTRYIICFAIIGAALTGLNVAF